MCWRTEHFICKHSLHGELMELLFFFIYFLFFIYLQAYNRQDIRAKYEIPHLCTSTTSSVPAIVIIINAL